MWCHRHRLVNSNEVPLGSDVGVVKSVISRICARLAVVEYEISRLRDRMEYWEEERVSLSGHLAQNNSILSPLRRTPPKILGEIFS
ncbi:hypothetical protein C8R44DRAFT_783287 [Mycena epipterygia]|nr:hypothetical protein C8R44DRAFT_783287 [Mycena epipterygia]